MALVGVGGGSGRCPSMEDSFDGASMSPVTASGLKETTPVLQNADKMVSFVIAQM